jgi:ESF2/ABP1 family protein
VYFDLLSSIQVMTDSDSHFATNDNFFGEPKAESSLSAPTNSHILRDQSSDHDHEDNELDGEDEVLGDNSHDLAEGMDAEGFSGPSKVVKPLTPQALAAFKAAQERAGVIYISRIPPGMRPTKVRHLMSAYGDVGRVYLQQEGALGFTDRCYLISDMFSDLIFSFLT